MIGRVIGMEQGLDHDGVFSDIYLKGVGGPSASCLNQEGGGTSLGKCSSAARSQGLSANVIVEKQAQAADHERPGGDTTIPAQP